MNPILYMLAGAAVLAVGIGLYLAGREALKAATALTAALAAIPKLMKSLADNSEALNKFSGELEFLRTAMVGGTPNIGPENPKETTAPQRPRTPYPGAPPTFVPVPDAEENETLVIDTTDQEYLDQETLENVRGMGFEAEPLENPPGVTKEI